ncbi:dicarboxylate/amino acid:cation symporter [Luteolibacter flavescens]|uniref:Dicarboxylate/amino acid:cation symporter n=1 Tax=Luteolibacter flavescens TaxID=1859460 RepID=A0ABT3FUG6_9BACT|nr:dicarboxylate/amino acid:cation symporter [Luteolibacter flavescens]MCW1887205.1 dicarboxylate/amino acid:cation symporter [Luteolibacter flavescens]
MKNRLALHWQILAALLLATLTAASFRGIFGEASESSFVNAALEGCKLVGDLFLRALKMIIIPLIVTSVVGGIAGLKDAQGFGRLGLKTIGFYMGTGLLAILLGLVLVSVIAPGLTDGQPNESIRNAFAQGTGVNPADMEKIAAASGSVPEGKGIWESISGIFRSMLPENIFAAAASNESVLGVLIFSLLFAAAVTKLPEQQGKSLREFFVAASEAVGTIVHWIMAFAPIGVYALILPVIYSTGFGLFANLGKYVVTVLLALGLHLFVTMPLVLMLVARVNPMRHFSAVKQALIMAFSTASSAATLPLTMESVRDRVGVSSRVTSFTLPIGTSINTDGTALYECVAVMFVAQVMGVHMGFAEMFFVVLAALLTSVGIAGVPHASLVAILLILKNSGIQGAEAAMGVLLAVDRFLDMSRTAVNVFGDTCVAVLVARSEGEETLVKN